MVHTMFEETVIRGVAFRPALFCAPMAGITHRAFRRLVAEFGGCGGFYTEMLSARHILHEDMRSAPWLRRDAAEPRLIYQLMLRDGDPLDRIIDRLATLTPDGIDLNLACHAPTVRQLDAGSRLFENLPVLHPRFFEDRFKRRARHELFPWAASRKRATAPSASSTRPRPLTPWRP